MPLSRPTSIAPAQATVPKPPSRPASNTSVSNTDPQSFGATSSAIAPIDTRPIDKSLMTADEIAKVLSPERLNTLVFVVVTTGVTFLLGLAWALGPLTLWLERRDAARASASQRMLPVSSSAKI